MDKPKIAYVEDVTKHRMKLPLYDLYPKTENAWIAPNATVSKLLHLKVFIINNHNHYGKKKINDIFNIVGEVLLRRWSSIWYNTVIRGDINRIE